MLPYFWNRKKPLNALVSLHRDGRMIAGLLEKFGLGTIGGSSNENASGAAVKLMHSLKDDTAICIIPDRSRDPGCIWDALLFIMRKKPENLSPVFRTASPTLSA